MNRIFSILCVAIFTLPACSRIDIAYSWADTFIASKVDDYFDISSRQSRELKQSLNKDLAKMKAEVLPGWIDDARKLEQEVATGTLNEKKIAGLFTAILSDVETLPAHFSETAVRFIASTDEKQLRYFAKSFDEKTNEEFKKFQDQEKFIREYRKKYTKYFEMFLGSLTPEQSQAIDEHIAKKPYPTALKLKNRDWVFQQFTAKKGNPESLKDFVRKFVKNPQELHLPEYKLAVKDFQKDLENLIIQVALKMTPQQKKELRENLLEKVAQLQRIQNRS